MKCIAGCISYTSGEIYHHKDCPFYPDSFSKRYDDLKKNISGLCDVVDINNKINVLKKLTNFADENISKALDRCDYSAAVKADNYKAGLNTAIGVLEKNE